MKTKKPILRLVALAALSFFTGNEVVAQTNIGAACGCPSYATRPVVSIAGVGAGASGAGTWTTLPSGAYGKELLGNQNIVLTCNTTWVLDQKLYIGPGSTLTIEPGTVIKGAVAGSAAAATALIIERGGKIIAPGVEECPIIFTALADALNGAYPVNNKGMWGGVLICGTASNNLTLALNGPFIPGQQGKLAAADGLGVLEGFASSYPQDQYGANISANAGYLSATSPANLSYTFGLSTNAASAASGNNPAHGSSGLNIIRINSAQTGLAAYALPGSVIENSTYLPSGTTVVSVSGDYITLSNSLLVNVPVSTVFTFTNNYPQAANTNGQYFQMSAVPAFSGTVTGPVVAVAGSNPTTYVNFAAAYIGSGATAFNDNDNSGVMTYVSIRHSGANLLVGSEINGLTLASVGRGTKIEHIEIVSCADDNIEIFGGTVDLKYCTTLYGNDDMYDYDLGWTGKAQFLFGMKADHAGTPSVSQDNDNGFEADGGDNNQTINQSNPTIYNATILGNAKTAGTADNRALAAMNFKEGSKGTLNNSVFAHFKNGLNVESGLVAPMTANAYQNWATTATATAGSIPSNNSQSLKVKCNTFIGVTNPMTLNASSLAANGQTANGAANTANTAQWTADNNLALTQAEGITAGFNYAFAINGSTNAITTKNDVVPNTGVAAFQLGSGCAQAPMDGFFSPANYRGAFAPSANNENWLSDWTYSQVLNSTSGVTACPTDINNDGTTDVNDFLIFSGQFGQACN